MTKENNKKKNDDKVVLNLRDRFSILELNFEKTYESLLVKRDLDKKVEPTQEEIIKYKIREEVYSYGSKTILWDKEAEKEKFSYNFTKLETQKIKEALKQLNDNKKLEARFLNLYEIFIVGNK